MKEPRLNIILSIFKDTIAIASKNPDVITRVVEEEGDKGMINYGNKNRGVEKRIDVGGKLPQAACPAARRPTWHGVTPVYLFFDKYQELF